MNTTHKIMIFLAVVVFIGVGIWGFWRIFDSVGKYEEQQKIFRANCGKPSGLTCEEVQQCYDDCDHKNLITWAMNCRDKLKPYLWKCYGVGEPQ